MPQAIIFIAEKVGVYVFTALTEAGISVGTAATIANVAYFATIGGSYVALSAATAYATRPDTPSPEAGKFTVAQARPPRQRGIGRCRRSGFYVLNEAQSGILHQVIAVNDGRVASFDQFWLHDDPVTIIDGVVQELADRAYETGRVQVEYRLGAPVETAYVSPQIELPAGVWTPSHRLDGIASLHMRCTNGKLQDFARQFPNGIPQLSARVDHVAFDWRDPDQSVGDPLTWKFSANPVVGLVHELCQFRGLDWTRRVLPVLASITAEADYCDDLVEQADGSTAPRYAVGGFFDATNTPAAIYGRFLESCDGWMSTDGRGHLIFKAGRYDAPTVTFGEDAVRGYQFQKGTEEENAVNSLIVSFSSPAHDYSEVETTAWVDQDAVDERGEELTQPLSLPWVQNNSQARRLAKRRLSQIAAPIRLSVRTNLAGLAGLGHRFIRLQIPELASLANIVMEVQGLEIDLATLTMTYQLISADPNIDAWNAATEEGPGPTLEDRAPPDILAKPGIDADETEIFDAEVSSGETGSRLRIVLDAFPDRLDLSWFVRWRVVGATSWVEASATDGDAGPGVKLETGFVPTGVSLEYGAAYLTGAGTLSPWSDIETIAT